jgi:hypothetical protein
MTPDYVGNLQEHPQPQQHTLHTQQPQPGNQQQQQQGMPRQSDPDAQRNWQREVRVFWPGGKRCGCMHHDGVLTTAAVNRPRHLLCVSGFASRVSAQHSLARRTPYTTYSYDGIMMQILCALRQRSRLHDLSTVVCPPCLHLCGLCAAQPGAACGGPPAGDAGVHHRQQGRRQQQQSSKQAGLLNTHHGPGCLGSHGEQSAVLLAVHSSEVLCSMLAACAVCLLYGRYACCNVLCCGHVHTQNAIAVHASAW